MLATRLGTILSQHRYFVLCLFVFYKVAIYATNGLWYGDFWEHSAVVAAFMANPLHPSHPLFDLSAPHAFQSPYHLLVAMVARATAMDVVDCLALFGVINFGLIASGLFYYISSFAGRDASRSSFYALLCILFLWGTNPWGYSGFLHFDQLADVLPYASTFAMAISFFVLAIGFCQFETFAAWRTVAVIAMGSIVLLSHPLTFVFLASGLFCQCLVPGTTMLVRRVARVTIEISACAALSALWPYYSIVALLTGAGSVYHPSNLGMYVDVLPRIWPILVLSPLLLGSIGEARQRTILFHMAALILIYCLGYISGNYSYGRDITFVAMLAQILIGHRVARIEAQFEATHPSGAGLARIVFAAVLVACSVTWLLPTFTRSLTVLNSLRIGRQVSNQQMYGNLTFLPQFVQPGEVVLADVETSWLVPTFAGKIIAGLHAQAFVADHDQRLSDLNRFFDPQSTESDRQSIVATYRPSFLLLDKQDTTNWRQIAAQFDGDPGKCRVFENARYQLIRLDCQKQ
jgi:alpha-1,6-mannosyltransferase